MLQESVQTKRLLLKGAEPSARSAGCSEAEAQ